MRRLPQSLFACPCCGYRTLEEPPPGTYLICEVCYWEDDDVQFYDPDLAGGANRVSLREAQANFGEHGVSDVRFRAQVRAITSEDIRDDVWKPVE